MISTSILVGPRNAESHESEIFITLGSDEFANAQFSEKVSTLQRQPEFLSSSTTCKNSFKFCSFNLKYNKAIKIPKINKNSMISFGNIAITENNLLALPYA